MKPREELKKEKIAVIYGGPSKEREISLKTGQAVLSALVKEGYEVTGLELDENIFSILQKEKIKYVFNATHGIPGEDGSITGALEFLGIRCTGTSPSSSCITMDKHLTKKIFKGVGLPTADWKLIDKNYQGAGNELTRVPCVIKPRNGGSAIGVKIVREKEEFTGKFDLIRNLAREFIVEKYIPGKEITIGFLGRDLLPIIEIVPVNEFYDFDAKYKAGKSEHIIPAGISSETEKRIREIAGKCIKEFDLTVMARIDMIIGEESGISVLEINTIPGMTGTSLFPEACKYIGIDFTEMVLRIMDLSFGEK